MTKQTALKLVPLGLSILVGVVMAMFFNFNLGKTQAQLPYSESFQADDRVPIQSLEEQLWFVDAVVVGTVMEQNDTFMKDSGVPTKQKYTFPVTPATIKVDKVIHGEISGETITLNQHGTSDSKIDSETFVNKDGKYVFFLTKTKTPGSFWTFNGQEGRWLIENNKVIAQATANVQALDSLNNVDLDSFLDTVSQAAKNKKKPDALQQ